MSGHLFLCSIFSQWEVCKLLLFLGVEGGLMLGKGTSHGTGLFGPQIKRFELLAFVELAQVLTLRMADDSKHLSNGFTNKFYFGEFGSSSSCHLSNFQC